MLRVGVIEPSGSPWNYPVVLIKKTTGTYEFCMDMRRDNDASVKECLPSSKDQRHLGKASTGEVHQ